jgi:3-dehydroquinate dehydratase II
MATIRVLHGPNLNLLGQREPHIYGTQTLAELNDCLATLAHQLGHKLQCQQSNAEHMLIEYIHSCMAERVDFIIINPAAYGHTSIALFDAFKASAIPFIEVHLSNIYARETFRQHTLLSSIATGVIAGLGTASYLFALHAADQHLTQQAN